MRKNFSAVLERSDSGDIVRFPAKGNFRPDGEMADATDLKSVILQVCGFESRSGHHFSFLIALTATAGVNSRLFSGAATVGMETVPDSISFPENPENISGIFREKKTHFCRMISMNSAGRWGMSPIPGESWSQPIRFVPSEKLTSTVRRQPELPVSRNGLTAMGENAIS